jgi:hypothetical protein
VNGQVEINFIRYIHAFATSQGHKGCVEVEEESSNEKAMALEFGLLLLVSKLMPSQCPNIIFEGLSN